MSIARAYIIPVRSDCPGANLQVLDLIPNTSLRLEYYGPAMNHQRTVVKDGPPDSGRYIPGQTFYLRGADSPVGETLVVGDAYAGGTRMTVLKAASDAVVGDTTGGGNDCFTTPKTEFGLAAYLRECVQPGGVALATAGRLDPADAQTLAQSIMALVYFGENLDVEEINEVLCDIHSGGTAGTDFDGKAVNSKSFGDVETLLRILSGETYIVPRNTIITNEDEEFLGKDERNILVEAATQGKFYSTGRFLNPDEPGYVRLPVVELTGALRASAVEGNLRGWTKRHRFTNPNFAYDTNGIILGKPRAVQWNGVPVPPTGETELVARVYTFEGELIED